MMIARILLAVFGLLVLACLAPGAVAGTKLNTRVAFAEISVDPGAFKGAYSVGRVSKTSGCKPDAHGMVTGKCTFLVRRRAGTQISFATGWGGAAIGVDASGKIRTVVPKGAAVIGPNGKSIKFNTESFRLSAPAYLGVYSTSLIKGKPFKIAPTKSRLLVAVRNVRFSVGNGDTYGHSVMSVIIDGKGVLRAVVPVGSKTTNMYTSRKLALEIAPVILLPNSAGLSHRLSGFGTFKITKQAKYWVLAGLLTVDHTISSRNRVIGEVRFYPHAPG